MGEWDQFYDLDAFKAEMRMQGIHVGVSRGGGGCFCACCDEFWPCQAEVKARTEVRP
jgi:hypothetical protein